MKTIIKKMAIYPTGDCGYGVFYNDILISKELITSPEKKPRRKDFLYEYKKLNNPKRIIELINYEEENPQELIFDEATIKEIFCEAQLRLLILYNRAFFFAQNIIKVTDDEKPFFPNGEYDSIKKKSIQNLNDINEKRNALISKVISLNLFDQEYGIKIFGESMSSDKPKAVFFINGVYVIFKVNLLPEEIQRFIFSTAGVEPLLQEQFRLNNMKNISYVHIPDYSYLDRNLKILGLDKD